MKVPSESKIVPTADISIVAANYNNALFLEEFFESILHSTMMPKEIIFVDDGSADNSLSIAKTYETRIPGMNIIALPKNQGFGNALNIGISHATGSYIMRVDPDDYIHPERILRQYNAITEENLDVVGTNAYIFHSSTRKILGTTNFPKTHQEIKSKILIGEHGVLHATTLIRSSYLKKTLFVQKNVPAEDYDVFARIFLAGGRFKNLTECLTYYRVHENSASNILPFSTIEKTFKIRDELFKTKTSKLKVTAYYLYIKNYRKFLFERRGIKKLFYGVLSSLFYPKKLISRLARAFNA
ncbi:glycosyltransferase family 2 protein [Pseudomonas silesiensis]